MNFSLLNEGMFYGGFDKNVALNSGELVNVQLMRGNSPITPKHPLTISVETNSGKEFLFVGVMHKSEQDRYDFIPQSQ